MFSCKPTKRRFTDYTGAATDIGFSISTFPERDDGELAQASDSDCRRFWCMVVISSARQQVSTNGVMSWQHAGVSPAALFPFSGALPAFCAVVYGSRVVRQQIMRSGDVWHSAALAMCLCPPHATLNSSFSSISRAFQLHLQLLGGMSHALLTKLDLQCKARGLVARKIASILARDVFRCFNEEGDRRWVAFIATKELWTFLLPKKRYHDEQSAAKVQKSSMVGQ